MSASDCGRVSGIFENAQICAPRFFGRVDEATRSILRLFDEVGLINL